MTAATTADTFPGWGLVASRGHLLVVSGPSGVGKDAVLKALFASPECPEGLVRCVTATTRAPRAGEVDGQDYAFLERDEFLQRVARGYFLEHALYAGDHYGTPREAVEQMRSQGRDVLLKIEVQGALQVRRSLPEAILVFVLPPSWEELGRRLKQRATDDDAEIDRRLAIARAELDAASAYDYAVVNDSIERAADRIRAIVLAERARIVAQAPDPRSP